MLNCVYHSSLSVNLKFFCSSNLLGVKIFVWYYSQCFFILCFLKDKILRAFQILFIFILALGTVNIVVVLGVKYRRKQTELGIHSVAQALSGVCYCMWWVDWNSVLQAVCSTLGLTLASVSSSQLRERNCFHSEMKGLYFSSCCLFIWLLQQNTYLKCWWSCNRPCSFQTPCNSHTVPIVIVPFFTVNL